MWPFEGVQQKVWISAGILVGVVCALTLATTLTFGKSGYNIATLTLVQLSAVLALAVFSGNSGIVSFGHAAFLGVGAYVSGLLTMPVGTQHTALPHLPAFLQGHELTLVAALAVCIVCGAAVGFLTGFPIVRMSTGSAPIGTLALMIVVHVLLIGATDITRGSQTFFGVPRLTTIWTALITTSVFIVIARLFRETSLGLQLRASRENEVAAAAHGVDVRKTRHKAWVLSAAMATVAGALYGHFLGAFSPKDFYFDLTFAIVAMLIVGGLQTVTGAVGGTIVLAAVVQILRQAEGGVAVAGVELPAIFGLTQLGMGLALVLTIWKRPLGLFAKAELGDKWLSARQSPKLSTPMPLQHSAAPDLSIAGVSRHFGGLRAIEDVSFAVSCGQIVGLIGPNGAGKTTLINTICGQLPVSRGKVSIGNVELTGRWPYSVARRGLARTFQNIHLFERLSALENVTVAALAKTGSLREARARAMQQLQALNIDHGADKEAGSFSYGDRRRLEIARALALSPHYLLLDEPAAGMNPAETDQLIVALRKISAGTSMGLIVVEHDMRLIMNLCDRVVVLNKGQLIAQGSPAEIRENAAVIDAYIGTNHKRQTEGRTYQ